MKSKILVHGKSQSRTALGIVNAYLKLFPGVTPSELQIAFPKSLNRRCTAENLIIPVAETKGHEKMFFEREDEMIVFSNGEKFALIEVWDREDFNGICEHAKQFGIEVAKEGTKPFEKGSFELEFLNGDAKKCRFKWWWILLLILLLLLLIFCCRKCCGGGNSCSKKPAVVENVEKAASVHDAKHSTSNLITDSGASISVKLPDGNVFSLDKNSQEYKLFSFLNSDAKIEDDPAEGWIVLDHEHFETGKAELLPESESQLKNVAMIMQFFPNAHLKIGGYTDDTGTDAINMRISSERAKVTAEKLISLGVAENRLTHEGYGSQRPVSPSGSEDARAANRRVDIKAVRK